MGDGETGQMGLFDGTAHDEPPAVTCKKCGAEREARERCKPCRREYLAKNRARILERTAEYRAKNRARILERKAEYRAKNREMILERKAEYRAKNKARIARSACEHKKRRRQSDPSYSMHVNISRSVRRGLNGHVYGAFRHLPYTKEQLYARLITTLPPGYTEADIRDGRKLHIDHIRPVSSFNLTGEVDDEFLACWALDNLQLLPAAENLAKGASWDGARA